MAPLCAFDKVIATAEKAQHVAAFSKNDGSKHNKNLPRSRLKKFYDDNDFKIVFELPSNFLSYDAFVDMNKKLVGTTGIETVLFVLGIFTDKMKEQRRKIDTKLKDSIVCESINRLYDSISRTEDELGVVFKRAQHLQDTVLEKNEIIYDLVNDNKALSMEIIRKCEVIKDNQIISDCGIFTLKKIIDQSSRNQWHYTSNVKKDSNTDDDEVFAYNCRANSIKSEFEIDCSVYQNEHGCLTLFCVVVDGEIDDKFLSIRALHGALNMCIREESFTFCNLELMYNIPTDISFDIINLTWEHIAQPSRRSIVCGLSSGPYFDGTEWTDQSTVWIFSRYGGFIDIDFPLPTQHKFHIFECRRKSLADYERTDEDAGLFSGLRMYLEIKARESKVARLNQSVGPYIEIKDKCGNSVKGVLSTRHASQIYKNGYLENDDEMYIDTVEGQQLLGKIKTFGTFDSPLLTKVDSRYVVNDFVVVECGLKESLKVGIIEDEEYSCSFQFMSSVGDVSTTKTISKVGQKTGHTTGLYINTIKIFETYLKPPPTKELSVEFEENMYKYTTCGNIIACSYILVYDCDNNFADKGDSGGLCFVKGDSDELIGVGIVAERLCPRLFLIIPLSLIEEAISKNFNCEVKWMTE